VSRVRVLLGICFLAAQVPLVVYAQRSGTRWFCWAPHDIVVEYDLDVWIRGERLDAEAVRRRYGRPWFEETSLSDRAPSVCGWVRCGPGSPRTRDSEGYRIYEMAEFRSPVHIIEIVEQYETTYGRNDSARVELRYRVNGGSQRVWKRPG